MEELWACKAITKSTNQNFQKLWSNYHQHTSCKHCAMIMCSSTYTNTHRKSRVSSWHQKQKRFPWKYQWRKPVSSNNPTRLNPRALALLCYARLDVHVPGSRSLTSLVLVRPGPVIFRGIPWKSYLFLVLTLHMSDIDRVTFSKILQE